MFSGKPLGTLIMDKIKGVLNNFGGKHNEQNFINKNSSIEDIKI